MVHKHLTDLLDRLGFSRDEAAGAVAFGAPAGHTSSVYLARGEEALILDGVVRLELAGDVAIVATARRERYGVEIEEIVALRVVADKR